MLTRIWKIYIVVAGVLASSASFSGESTMTNPMLSDARPWCIGRFVFDRPAASEISNQKYEYDGDAIQTQYDVPLETYRAKVEARERELRNKRRIDPANRNRETARSWLEQSFSPTRDSRVFVYQSALTDGVDLPFHSEAYIYEKGTVFHAVGKIGSSVLGEAEAMLSGTYRRFKARDNWTVPIESGFCFDGGMATGPSTSTEEVSQSFALMPGRPALFVIQMRDSTKADQYEPLTKTLPQLRAQLSHMPGHYRILREGKRTVAGTNAEEVLFELKDEGITSYRFYLLAPGDPSTLAKPHTTIQLLLGASSPDLTPEQATSPVDEAGALEVWNTLLNSLRLRPGAI